MRGLKYISSAMVPIGASLDVWKHLSPGFREQMGIIGEHIGNYGFSALICMAGEVIGQLVENHRDEQLGRAIRIGTPLLTIAGNIAAELLTTNNPISEASGDMLFGTLGILTGIVAAQHFLEKIWYINT